MPCLNLLTLDIHTVDEPKKPKTIQVNCLKCKGCMEDFKKLQAFDSKKTRKSKRG